MCSPWSGWRSSWLAVSLGLALVPGMLLAVDRSGQPPKSGPAGDQVEMFDAIDKGQIAVRMIPKNSKEANLLIENKTKVPLTVKLPEAFAGVPVLAQRGGAAGGGARGGGNNNNQNQGMMGGMGGGMMGGGRGGMGGGMGMFYVAPEKVGQVKFPGVCLEHGKAEPSAKVPYEVRPIESVTDKPEVWEIGKLLGKGQINQRAAQAATWHLNNDMSWEQLTAKRLKFANGTSQPYFSPQEIRAAMQVTAVATQLAQQRQKPSDSEN
jgi:hypothetical protein